MPQFSRAPQSSLHAGSPRPRFNKDARLGLLRRALALCVVLSSALGWLGCSSPDTDTKTDETALAFEGVSLRVNVVGDDAQGGSAAADVLERLASEWQARTGSKLSIARTTEADFLAQPDLGGDVALVPSYLAGLAAERKWTAPLPNAEGNASPLSREVFLDLRNFEAGWDRKSIGIPLGAPRLMLAYRADLLEKWQQQPPRTWDEYNALVEFASQQTEAGMTAAVAEPTAGNWPALVFLAKAAPLAKHKDYYSALFDMDSMQPLIAGPAFVETLTAAVAGHAHVAPADDITPRSAYEQLHSGQVALALTWSSSHWAESAPVAGARIAYTPLPGATRVYTPGKGNAEDVPLRHVSLSNFSGIVGLVSSAAESETADAAWQLLKEFSSPDWNTQLTTAGANMLPCRETMTTDMTPWLPQDTAVAATSLGQAVAAAFAADDSLAALPIPGRDRYLASLTAALQRANSGEQTPDSALQQAAEEWDKITEELGRDTQRTHYRASVTHRF